MAGSLIANLALTPKDAVAFFAAKGEMLSWDWHDVDAQTHARAFTVAKATNLEVLRTIRAEVEKSIAGQSFEDFKKNLRPRLQELGWWGKKEMLDADTGEITKVQLGSDRRLRTIFQANVQSAYMAGRYARYVDNVKDRPFWKYVAIRDGRTRESHAALNGKVWRWDDPIWRVIWPPNGWGCRCRVTALTDSQFKASGEQLQDGRDAIAEIDVPVNRNGDTVKVKTVKFKDGTGKERIFRPDPSWDHNPGATWPRFDPAGLKQDVVNVPPVTPPSPAGGAKARDNLPTWKDFGRPDLRAPGLPRRPDPGLLPTAEGVDAAIGQMRDVLVPNGTMQVIQTPIEKVAIRPELLPHTVIKRADARERYANYALDTLVNPFEVWLTAYDDGSYRKRYIGIFQAKNDLMVVVRENVDGSLYWDVYNLMQRDAKHLNNLRAGALLYGLAVVATTEGL
ncbi:MAG: phage minor head protein [Sulfuricellaceae bacterium]